MKQSEKIILGVAAIVVVGFVVVEFVLPDSSPKAHVQVTKVPDPISVSVPEYENKATDSIPVMTPRVEELKGLEHELLLTGYKSKIAENIKTKVLSEQEARRGEIELKQMTDSREGFQAAQPIGTQFAEGQATKQVEPKKRTEIIVNKFNANNSALITVDGAVHTVITGTVVDGVKVLSIDATRKTVRVLNAGQTSDVVLSTSSSRAVATVNKLTKSETTN